MSKSYKPSRRGVVSGMAALPFVPALAANAGVSAQGAANRLWYRQPATRWEEALPLGNGRLGAMVFGRVGQERLQLNEDTLWSGGPYTPDSPDALAALPEVRRLIAEERYKDAADLAGAKMMARPLSQMSYGSLGDIFLEFDKWSVPETYERRLDLDTAISSVTYDTPQGAIVREVFASASDQVVVLHIDAKAPIGFGLAYRGPRAVKYTAANYQGVATAGGAKPPVDWGQREDSASTSEIQIRQDGPGAWLITGKNVGGNGIAPALTFALRVKVITDGELTVSNTAFSVRNAKTTRLLISAATSYVNFRDTSGDPVAVARQRSDQAARKSYARLKADHIKDHQSLFRTVSVDLGRTSAADLPTDERIVAADTADDPALAALYLQYARYLLIASSRPGTQPANLQGIWNEATNPPWGSKYTININTEMNYWLAGPAGLGSCVEPLLRMAEELAITGARTAKTMYNARGWVAHHNTDLWRAAAPIDGPLWGLWPCGGAWLCTTLWDQYDYSRDPAMLARLYPLMRNASLFFLDTLIEDPKGRGLVTSPSVSPENSHPFNSSVCAGPAMDRQIVRDLFHHTIAAAKILGRDGELVTQLDATVRRIAPDRIGKTGQLQEWLEDWDDAAPEPEHRHISHLYALYPGSEINVRDTPDFVKAAQVTLNRRGDFSTGWAIAWRICCWARIGDGDHTHKILRALLGAQRTYPNMFDAHPPFQIDGNFGAAMGIMEMILQSWGGEIIVLPALPSAWPAGHLKGVRARGNITADIAWSGGKLRSLVLKGKPAQAVALRHAGELKTVTLDAKGVYTLKV